jgi:hypothetical protein
MLLHVLLSRRIAFVIGPSVRTVLRPQFYSAIAVIYLKHGVILGNLAGIMPLATCAVAISRLNWT